MAAVDPLVLSGPCAGLTVAAFRRADGAHPPVTGVTSVGAVDHHGRRPGARSARLAARASTGFRTSSAPPLSRHDPDVPYAFVNGLGVLVTYGSATNQTGVVQLFLDCKGLVCAGSGAPLATITVQVTGTAPGAASLPFEPAAPSSAPSDRRTSVTVPVADRAVPGRGAAGARGCGLQRLSAWAMRAAVGRPACVVAQDPPAGVGGPEDRWGHDDRVRDRPPAGASTPVVPHGVVSPAYLRAFLRRCPPRGAGDAVGRGAVVG